MAESKTKRRGAGEDSIFFLAERNRYVGDVSLGFRPGGRRIRRQVAGRTKQEVRDQLKAVHADLDAGLKVLARTRLVGPLMTGCGMGLSSLAQDGPASRSRAAET
jgi:hypothetical protein